MYDGRKDRIVRNRHYFLMEDRNAAGGRCGSICVITGERMMSLHGRNDIFSGRAGSLSPSEESHMSVLPLSGNRKIRVAGLIRCIKIMN